MLLQCVNLSLCRGFQALTLGPACRGPNSRTCKFRDGRKEKTPTADPYSAGTSSREAPAVQTRSGSSDTRLSLSAIRPSSGSEPAFIFCIALLRCTFTVASAMPISWAICLLRRPRAT